MENAGLALLIQVGMGYVWQWARGPKKIPGWLSWTVFGIAAAFGWVWATPGAFARFADDWRNALYLMASFMLATRGSASSSADVKVAPKTNSQ
jgi:hypothetical protein